MKPVTLFGLSLCNPTMDEALEQCMQGVEAGERRTVFFINAHCVNVAFRDAGYREALRRADWLFADGMGMALAARRWGATLRGNVNGTDLYPRLCERLQRGQAGLFLLGAKPGVAERMRDRSQQCYPGMRIHGIQHGYFTEAQSDEVIAQVNASGADIVLVALGVPAQEKWIAQHRDEIEAPLVMGVGGLFDFYSGDVPRAPLWMRRAGLEWLFRMVQEPGRLWRRYLIGNGVFLWRTLLKRSL